MCLDISQLCERDLKVKDVGEGNLREALLRMEDQINIENKVTFGDVTMKRKKQKGEIKVNIVQKLDK